MRAEVPDGDLAAIIEAAVSEKLERFEASRYARTTSAPRNRLADTDTSPTSRHIPAPGPARLRPWGDRPIPTVEAGPRNAPWHIDIHPSDQGARARMRTAEQWVRHRTRHATLRLVNDTAKGTGRATGASHSARKPFANPLRLRPCCVGSPWRSRGRIGAHGTAPWTFRRPRDFPSSGFPCVVDRPERPHPPRYAGARFSMRTTVPPLGGNECWTSSMNWRMKKMPRP